MVVRKDFVVGADNLVWIDRDSLVELVPSRRFRTPTHFYEGTLCVFVNGVHVEKNNDDGFIVIDDETFEMREDTPLPRFRVTVGYVKKEV